MTDAEDDTAGDVELQEMQEEEAEDDNVEGEPVDAAGDTAIDMADEAGNAPGGTAAGGAPRPNISTPILFMAVLSLAAAVIILSIVIILDDDDGNPIATNIPVQPPSETPTPSTTVRDETFVQEPGLAQVPNALVNFLKENVFLPGTQQLALPPDMLKSLNGHCSELKDYRPAENNQYWQCQQSKANPNFPLTNDTSGIPYMPTDDVLSLMANVTGTTVEALRKINISSGQPDAEPGSWCGMPAADHSNKNRTQQQELAYKYWLTCVAPRAGFFNVLECAGECPTGGTEEDCTTYAVLGYAALEPNVCYPAHQHHAQEAYWQIGGRGWWRTWNDVSGFDNLTYASNVNFPGSTEAFHAHRSEVPHEFDTTGDLDGDGGAGISKDNPMVLLYWWGLENGGASNNYRWSPDVRDNAITHQYQPSAVSCGDTRRIPVFNGVEGSQNISLLNC